MDRKMKANAARKAKRDANNDGPSPGRSRIHHKSCTCPQCGGEVVGRYAKIDGSTGEVLDAGSLCVGGANDQTKH